MKAPVGSCPGLNLYTAGQGHLLLAALHPSVLSVVCRARFFYVVIKSTSSPAPFVVRNRHVVAVLWFLSCPHSRDSIILGRLHLPMTYTFISSPLRQPSIEYLQSIFRHKFSLSFHITSQYLQSARNSFIHDRIYVLYIAKLI